VKKDYLWLKIEKHKVAHAFSRRGIFSMCRVGYVRHTGWPEMPEGATQCPGCLKAVEHWGSTPPDDFQLMSGKRELEGAAKVLQDIFQIGDEIE
jgi:hypothetical protein